MEYYAIRTGSDELTHWKYIKKVQKPNGKWRYIYNRSELDNYNSGKAVESEYTDSNGNVVKTKTIYRKSNSLFDGESSSTFGFNKNLTKTIVKKQGKLSRLQAKGEKWVFDKFLKKKNKKLSEASEKKGKSFVDKLFNKLGVSKTKKKPKYIAKAAMPNGLVRYFYSQLEYDAYIKRLNYQKNEPDFMKKIKKIDKNTIMQSDEDMAATNPKYNPYVDDYSMNCFKCTQVYELRRRGYDVTADVADKYNTAIEKLTNKQSNYAFNEMYKNPKIYQVNENGSVKDKSKMYNAPLDLGTWVDDSSKVYNNYSGKTLKTAIEKNNPPNSRGNISVRWKGGGAHSMVYEVDSKGNARILDCQTNTARSFDDVATASKYITFTRLDNLELKKGVLHNVESK
ncbi:MAG: toxin glutamine deamidase domain-containing protein [Phocaeicola sp.]